MHNTPTGFYTHNVYSKLSKDMKTALFLREVRDVIVETIGQRGGELPIHTVEGEQSATEIKPPGGL